MLIWTKEKNDFCDCDLHNFSQFLWKTYLFDSFCCFYFFHFLICALVQLLPVRKNAHPKALLLNKRPRRLIGHTVCDNFQISMLYHSTFHGSIYNFSNIHTCFISEGKIYGICSFVISLLFHVVYIYRIFVYLEKNLYLIESSSFAQHFLWAKEYRVIWSGKHFVLI